MMWILQRKDLFDNVTCKPGKSATPNKSIPMPFCIKDSPGVTAGVTVRRRDPVRKRLPIESLKDPNSKYGVLVTSFSSREGFSSHAAPSLVDATPNGVGSGSVPGKNTSCAVSFDEELGGVVKILDDGVTNVKE